jgi:hypothetical protein
VTIAAALATVAAGGSTLALASASRHAAQDTGGLSISPALIERAAAPGALGPVTVFNRSGQTLNVTVAARPWLQAADGKVTADRRHALPGVGVAQPAFTLAPGQSRQVGVTVSAIPAGGALYGALEVIGLPADAKTRKGVVLGYRLIGTVRMVPAAKTRKLAAKLKASGRTIVLDVRNLGNTLDPVSGSVTIRDPRGTRTPAIEDLRILPGNRVSLVLAKRLSRGTYNARVTLSQAGKRAASLKKKLNIR